MRQALPGGHSYKYLVRDNDSMFEGGFTEFLCNLEIEDKKTRKRSPWQNGFCERAIGSIKRELVAKIIPLNEKHLRKILRSYFKYYNEDRTQLGIGKDTPRGRLKEERPLGTVKAVNRVGGLYSRYYRRAS